LAASAVLVVLLLGACINEEPNTSPSIAFTPPTGNRQDMRQAIPLGFMYENSDGPDGAGGPALPCFGDPVAHYAISRYVDGRVDRPVVGHDLYVYADVSTAARVFAELATDVDAWIACQGYAGAASLSVGHPSFGAEAIEVAIPLPLDGAGDHAGEPRPTLLFRVGAAIIQLETHPGAGPPDTGARGRAEMLLDAKVMEARMCLYDPDCGPRPGLPAQLTKLHDGATAWAAMLGVLDEGDRNARPGAWVAAAAELGYRAQIATVGCDLGAPPPTATTSANASYVAVYFASQSDADAFADALPDLNVTVFEATTYCTTG
jgi:hypothetical protein